MTCRHCGKPVGLLRRLKGIPYCSDAHARADDLDPARLVLQTLLRPDTPAPVAYEPAPPDRAATAAQPDEHTEEVLEALLSALGEEPSPATAASADLPVEPPAEEELPPFAGFLAEWPEGCPLASKRDRAGWIRPRWDDPVPIPVQASLTGGRIGSELRGDEGWLALPDSAVPVPAIEAAAAPRISDAADPVMADLMPLVLAVCGSLSPLHGVEPVRHRSGPRPVCHSIHTPYSTLAELQIPVPVRQEQRDWDQTAASPDPAVEAAGPRQGGTELQDSLVQMLVELADE